MADPKLENKDIPPHELFRLNKDELPDSKIHEIKKHIDLGKLTKHEYLNFLSGKYNEYNLFDPNLKEDTNNFYKKRDFFYLIDRFFRYFYGSLPTKFLSKQFILDKKLHDEIFENLLHDSNHDYESIIGHPIFYLRNTDLETPSLSGSPFSKEKILDFIRKKPTKNKKHYYDLLDRLVNVFYTTYEDSNNNKDVSDLLNETILNHGIDFFNYKEPSISYLFNTVKIKPEAIKVFLNNVLEKFNEGNPINHIIRTDLFHNILNSSHIDHDSAEKIIDYLIKNNDKYKGPYGNIALRPILNILENENALPKERREEYINKILKDDTPHLLFDSADKLKYSFLRYYKKLTDDHINYILEHGTPQEKWYLFNNAHINPEYHKKMFDLWDKSEDPNWNRSDHKLIKEIYKNYIADHIQNNINHFPSFLSFIEDNYDLDDPDVQEGLFDITKNDFVNDYLNDIDDWTAKDTEGNIVDYSDEKHLHPDYDKLVEDAEHDWYDHIDQILHDVNNFKVNKPEIYNDYLEHLYDIVLDNKNKNNEEEYDNEEDSNDKIFDKIYHGENWLYDKQVLPKHIINSKDIDLSKINDLVLKRYKQKTDKIRQNSKLETTEEKKHLDEHIPKRYKEHYYGDNLHHYELAKAYADANGGSINIGTLNKMFPNSKEVWKKLFDNKSKIKSEEIAKKIEELPKIKYDISHGIWDAHDPQNLNARRQTVFRLDHSSETEDEILKDPKLTDLFADIQKISKISGHPSNSNTIAWARVDTTDPKKWFIDELQSDFSSNVRRALEDLGDTKKVELLKKIQEFHKNWREVLLHHIIHTAKANGVKEIYTHSPESKAEQIGESVVHTVYKDSYKRAPRYMGFIETSASNMPLTYIGKEAFFGKLSDQEIENRIKNHLGAFNYHNNLAKTHKYILDKGLIDHKIDPNRIRGLSDIAYQHNVNYDATPNKEIHEKLFRYHQSLADNHEEMIKKLGSSIPTDPNEKNDLESKINNSEGVDYLSALSDLTIAKVAAEMIKQHGENPAFLPKHYGDNELGKSIFQSEPMHTGHVFKLDPEIVKKHIEVIDLLIKTEMQDDDKIAIAQTLMNIKSQQQLIEQLKDQNPKAYEAIVDLVKVLVDLFKEVNHEPIEAVESQLETQAQMQNLQNEPNQMPEQNEEQMVNFRIPPHLPKITHGSKEFPIGVSREYNPRSAREKSPEGQWISVEGGIKREDWQ